MRWLQDNGHEQSKREKKEANWSLRPIAGPTDWSKAKTLGPSEEQLLTELYYDDSRWLEHMKTVCKRPGITLEQNLDNNGLYDKSIR